MTRFTFDITFRMDALESWKTRSVRREAWHEHGARRELLTEYLNSGYQVKSMKLTSTL